MRTWWTLSVVFAVVACGPKKAPASKAVVGWHTEEGWAGSCYYPKDFDTLGVGDRKLYRADVIQELMNQWTGKRNDGVSFDPDKVEDVETALLGRTEAVELVVAQNLEHCRKFMSGESPAGWGQWFRGVAAKITENDCPTPPLRYQLFDYLDVQKGWQIPAGVCKGDEVHIHASADDYYRLSKTGPWINADGDPSQPATGGDYPCNIEGCFVGQLVLKFTALSGVESIRPVGTRGTFMVPEHGRIMVAINETSYIDNMYKTEGGVEHHTQIEYGPVDGE